MTTRNESGATTAEYAVGTVAAAGFGGVLLLLAPVYFHIVERTLGIVLGSVLRDLLHLPVPL